jgi:hypothetical protein
MAAEFLAKPQSLAVNANLATALNLLDFKTKESVQALFNYLHIAGYLSDEAVDKAVSYLSAATPFGADANTVKENLKTAYKLANHSGQFDSEIFCANFAKEAYFSVTDIIDLITFLQQTAFDREFGIERDKLLARPWMEERADSFMQYADRLGIVKACEPSYKRYCGIFVAGAATARVLSRIEDYKTYKVTNDSLWALSGARELSKGLDEENVMTEIAEAVNVPVKYVTKGEGKAAREFLAGVTETMMVNYLLRKMCPDEKFEIVNSAVQAGHWRATNSQNAKDIAVKILDGIERGELTKSEDGNYHTMIIAEQPYTHRMERQVQREFDNEIKRRNLKFPVKVEGCGRGITQVNKDTLTRMNSELGASMAERCTDARAKLGVQTGLRSSDILLYQPRDKAYKQLLETKKTAEETETNQLTT